MIPLRQSYVEVFKSGFCHSIILFRQILMQVELMTNTILRPGAKSEIKEFSNEIAQQGRNIHAAGIYTSAANREEIEMLIERNRVK